MSQIERLNSSIEGLREQLNGLIKRDENGPELLLVSQELDKLLVEYYEMLKRMEKSK